MRFHAKKDWEQNETEELFFDMSSLYYLNLERILRSQIRKGVFSSCMGYAQCARGLSMDLAQTGTAQSEPEMR